MLLKAGTYIFKNIPTLLDEITDYNVNFTSNGESFVGMRITSGAILYIPDFAEPAGTWVVAFTIDYGRWGTTNLSYQQVTIPEDTEVDDTFGIWFNDNIGNDEGGKQLVDVIVSEQGYTISFVDWYRAEGFTVNLFYSETLPSDDEAQPTDEANLLINMYYIESLNQLGTYYGEGRWEYIPVVSTITDVSEIDTTLEGENFYALVTGGSTDSGGDDNTEESTPSSITYNGVSKELASSKTATLSCNGKKMKSDVVITFGTSGTITYNGTTTNVDAGKTATLSCSGKKMKSDVVVSVG